jgi:hypothetical protein
MRESNDHVNRTGLTRACSRSCDGGAAAQAVRAIGAVGGALINLVFIDHFQDMARGHFTVRRLERKYDGVTVKAAYVALPSWGR